MRGPAQAPQADRGCRGALSKRLPHAEVPHEAAGTELEHRAGNGGVATGLIAGQNIGGADCISKLASNSARTSFIFIAHASSRRISPKS
jgi:hypothetical protein